MTAEVQVYGVVGAASAPSTPVDGTRHVTHRDVVAVVGDVGPDPRSAARALREHWRILDRLVDETTVLPVRFGTAMTGDDAVVDEFLAPNHDGLAAGLEQLAGKVQLTVKGTFDEQALLSDVVASSPAIARLKEEVDALPEAASYAKRIELGRLVASAVEQAREREGDRVIERLAPLAVASRREEVAGRDGAVNAAFLVERERVDELARAVAELGAERAPRVSLRCLGPLAPYSFTHDDVAAWA